MMLRREFGDQELGLEVWDEAAGDRLRSLLADTGWILPAGVGDRRGACSLATIQLAITGTLTDQIPKCMSRVIGSWIVRVQDMMSDEIRNSIEWRELLPLAAGTGRDELREAERDRILGEWHKQNTTCPYGLDRCTCASAPDEADAPAFWASAVGCLAKLVAT